MDSFIRLVRTLHSASDLASWARTRGAFCFHDRRQLGGNGPRDADACSSWNTWAALEAAQIWLGFLGLAAEEGGDVEIVGGNVLADFADVLLDLVDDVWHGALHRLIRYFAAGFPGLREE